MPASRATELQEGEGLAGALWLRPTPGWAVQWKKCLPILRSGSVTSMADASAVSAYCICRQTSRKAPAFSGSAIPSAADRLACGSAGRSASVPNPGHAHRVWLNPQYVQGPEPDCRSTCRSRKIPPPAIPDPMHSPLRSDPEAGPDMRTQPPDGAAIVGSLRRLSVSRLRISQGLA